VEKKNRFAFFSLFKNPGIQKKLLKEIAARVDVHENSGLR
jgi:hypothetical protein